MDEESDLAEELAAMEKRHRELDEKIARLEQQPFRDPMEMQRLKREKLVLKDQISHLRNSAIPDIIA